MRKLPAEIVILIALLPLLAGVVIAQEPIRFEAYTLAQEHPADRIAATAEAVGFRDWRRPEEHFVAPPIHRGLFANLDLPGREVRSCTVVPFQGEPWGHCHWSWRASEGGVDLKMTLTPSPRAAQEYLLADMTATMLPTEMVAAAYRAAERPEDLGEAGFVLGNGGGEGDDVTVRFARANLTVVVRGTGRSAPEALALARRVDTAILDQQPLTQEQLLSRRPSVTVEDRATEGGVAYRTNAPGDRRLLAVRGSVAGQPTAPSQGRLPLGTRKGSVEVEVLTITQDLLVGVGRSTVRAAD